MISCVQRSSTWARSGSSRVSGVFDVHVDVERRHVLGQRPQRRGQVDRAALAQLADRLAHVGQQQLAPACAPAARVPCARPSDRWPATSRLRLSAVRWWPSRSCSSREMRVRSLTRDAFGQQGAGGAQFGVQPALFLARLRLLPGDQAGDEHEAGEAQRTAATAAPRSAAGSPGRRTNTGTSGEVAARSARPRRRGSGSSQGSTPATTISRMLPRPVPVK